MQFFLFFCWSRWADRNFAIVRFCNTDTGVSSFVGGVKSQTGRGSPRWPSQPLSLRLDDQPQTGDKSKIISPFFILGTIVSLGGKVEGWLGFLLWMPLNTQAFSTTHLCTFVHSSCEVPIGDGSTNAKGGLGRCKLFLKQEKSPEEPHIVPPSVHNHLCITFESKNRHIYIYIYSQRNEGKFKRRHLSSGYSPRKYYCSPPTSSSSLRDFWHFSQYASRSVFRDGRGTTCMNGPVLQWFQDWLMMAIHQNGRRQARTQSIWTAGAAVGGQQTINTNVRVVYSDFRSTNPRRPASRETQRPMESEPWSWIPTIPSFPLRCGGTGSTTAIATLTAPSPGLSLQRPAVLGLQPPRTAHLTGTVKRSAIWRQRILSGSGVFGDWAFVVLWLQRVF